MRIIGGNRRGLKLAEVGEGDVSAHLRPTSDRVREAIFNLLINAHGNPVAGARVLDLFAGTGALGLEALSRGASEVTFVDDGAKALGLIKANIAKMRAEGETRVIRQDARVYAGLFDGDEQAVLEVATGRRLYVHVARGGLTANGEALRAGDALKLIGVTRLELASGRAAEVLVFDLPG